MKDRKQMEQFEKLKLSKGILQVIQELKFEAPSEIQEKTIPLIIEGKDVIASSATGSGKTLAFGSGIVERAKAGEGIQALVLTPTRELAEQVSQSIKKFSRSYGLDVIEIYGGVPMNPQIRNLRGADVVVGTPGRILDHLRNNTINLRKVKILVLDEADRMLEMGFINDVEQIINACPKERQTLLFSATIDRDIEIIGSRYMKHPTRVEVKSYVDPSKLKQLFYDVPQSMKFSLLVHLLKNEKEGLVMVFCNTRINTDFVANNLKLQGINAMAIHGGLAQNNRNRIMKDFHAGEVLILVCTDVATRGLDVKNVSHVYNYDTPMTAKEYIHRIGRTARAGKEGIAISLVSSRDYENFGNVCNDESLKIENIPVPEVENLRVEIVKRRYGGRGNFNRGRSEGSAGSRGRPDESRGRRDGGNGRSSGRNYGSNSRGFARTSGGSSRSFSRGRSDGSRRRY